MGGPYDLAATPIRTWKGILLKTSTMRAGLAAAGVAALACGALATPLFAATPDGNGPWADTVVSSAQGKRKNGTDVRAIRSNPLSALGVAELTRVDGTFFSLGFTGTITLGFTNPICNGTGSDLRV